MKQKLSLKLGKNFYSFCKAKSGFKNALEVHWPINFQCSILLFILNMPCIKSFMYKFFGLTYEFDPNTEFINV